MNNKKSLVNIMAIISVSSLIYFMQLNASTLPYIAKSFPQYDMTAIKMFSTLPYFMLIICPLIEWKLLQHFTMKEIVLFSCVVMVITGTALYGCSGLPEMLILRIIYGTGYGLVFPLASALVQHMFEGKQRDKMMGIRTAFGALCGSGMALVGGWLTSIHWRRTFLGYLLIIPVFILVYFFCPSNEPMKKKNKKNERIFTRKTWLLSPFAFILNICIISFSVELSLVLVGEGLGDAQEVSRVFAVNTIFAFGAGIIFGFVKQKLGKCVLLAATGLIGTGLLLGAVSQNYLMFMCFAAIFGIGFGWLNPIMNLLMADTVTDYRYGAQAIAVYTSCMGLGQFLYPYIWAGINRLTGRNILRLEWKMSGLFFLGLTAAGISLIHLKRRKKK